MLPRPFGLGQMSRMAGGPRKRVQLPEKAFVFALGSRAAFYCALDQLSFGCRRCDAFWIDGIGFCSGVLLVMFRTLISRQGRQ